MYLRMAKVLSQRNWSRSSLTFLRKLRCNTRSQLIAHATGVDVNIADSPVEMIVNVLDQNDNKPVFTQNPFNGNVPEAAGIGHEFMTVTATDDDDVEETNNGVISYSIVKQDPELPKPNLFTINPVTGGIRVNALGLDKETFSRYTLLITATDLNGGGYATTGTAVITVTDSNDNTTDIGKSQKIISLFVSGVFLFFVSLLSGLPVRRAVVPGWIVIVSCSGLPSLDFHTLSRILTTGSPSTFTEDITSTAPSAHLGSCATVPSVLCRLDPSVSVLTVLLSVLQ